MMQLERATNAKEIARPIADQVDWYIDESGEISAAHQIEPITTEQRLAVIVVVLADDVKSLAAERDALKAQLAEARVTLNIIAGIAYGRDGYATAEDLGELVDELYEIARAGRVEWLQGTPPEPPQKGGE